MPTNQRNFALVYAVNTTSASIVIPTPKTGLVGPTDGLIAAPRVSDSAGNASGVDNNVELQFFGVGANGNAATARITAWRQVSKLWVPKPLLLLTLTGGTQTGVAATEILNTSTFATTIALSGSAFTSAYELVSPGDNSIASVKIDFCGAAFIQVDFAKGTWTDCNAIAATF
jgi:hypothetical protein